MYEVRNMSKDAQKIFGYALIIVGFLMILANAVNYMRVFNVDLFPLMIIGLALLVVGRSLIPRR